MEYSSPEYWSVLPRPPPGDPPDPRKEPVSVKFPALAGGFFTTSAFWDARLVIIRMNLRELGCGSQDKWSAAAQDGLILTGHSKLCVLRSWVCVCVCVCVCV